MLRRDRIIVFIDTYMREQGCSPTVREICASEGIKTTSLIHRHLVRMEKRGLIYRERRFKSRGLHFTDKGRAYVLAIKEAELATAQAE